MAKKILRAQGASKAQVQGVLETLLKHTKDGTLGDFRLQVHAPFQDDPAGTDHRMLMIRHPPNMAADIVFGIWEAERKPDDGLHAVEAEIEGDIPDVNDTPKTKRASTRRKT